MQDKCCYYISGYDGSVTYLEGNGVFLCEALAIRGHAWEYSLSYRNALNMNNPARKTSVDVVFSSLSAWDNFRHICDVDVKNKRAGTLVIHPTVKGSKIEGGWRQHAYITQFSPSSVSPSHVTGQLEILLLDGCWKREHVVRLDDTERVDNRADFLDFEHDFLYDLLPPKTERLVHNNFSHAPSPIKIVVYGPCSTPEIKLKGNTYKVNMDVPDGAKLIIDGSTYPKSVMLEFADGVIESVFDKAERGQGKGSGSYIFEEISSGNARIEWNGCTADVYYYDVESEPPWNL